MSAQGGMVTLDEIIREAIADKSYNTLHPYLRWYGFAVRCLRTMNLDHTEEVKTVKLPVSVTKRVKYPEDYVAYNKLGVKVGDRMWVFVRDNSIIQHLEDKYEPNGKFYDDAISKTSSLRFFNFYPELGLNRSVVHNFIDINGYAHNGIGYFTPIDSCREFQLSSEVKSKHVYLEYISNNFNPDTQTLVPVVMQDVILNYIHYQEEKFKASGTIAQKREMEDDYFEALSTYDMRMSDLSYQGILDASRRHTTLKVKG